MADVTEKTEDAIIRRTSREDLVIEETQEKIQEFIFKNLNLENYLNDPEGEIAKLTRIASGLIGEAIEEGVDIGDKFGVELEKATG